jgi:FtsZ-binding cell division protein ZapB
MLEDLRENVLGLLEERVERAIHTIRRLREEKLDLESQIVRLHDELNQRETTIEELKSRNAELVSAESELQALREKREQEREEVEREKTEIRERLEGLMGMLNGVHQSTDSEEAG